MYDHIQPVPPDPILGLLEAYRNDPNPDKINLSVGVYVDETGNTPIFAAVKEAEKRLLAEEASKGYLGISGSAAYNEAVQDLLLGRTHDLVAGGRAATVQTPGGTGALRLAAEFLQRAYGKKTVWVSKPTWANHFGVFRTAGTPIEDYAYYDTGTNAVNFGAMLESIQEIPPGDILVLHACCHNPTGADLTEPQWRELAEIIESRGLVPLVDFAYQGLGEGIEPDAVALKVLAERETPLLCTSSCSKNFGLYCERVGALTVVTESPDETDRVLGNLKALARANYSNPPAHGAAVVSTIVSDEALRADWERELTEMRDRIQSIRALFTERLAETGVDRDFSFITRQRGMFSITGLSREQIDTLRDEYSIYLVGSGRINVAGINHSNVGPLCEAMAKVVKAG